MGAGKFCFYFLKMCSDLDENPSDGPSTRKRSACQGLQALLLMFDMSVCESVG